MRINEAFFSRDVLDTAPALVGKLICRRLSDGRLMSLRITQTEAYRGEEDLACHARKGRTARNDILYKRGGYSYVYLIYGLHWLMNAVTGKEDMPQAVLIRALEKPYNGPGKWTRALQVTGTENGIWLPDSQSLWIEQDGYIPVLETKPRIGVDYAPAEWRDKPWRWIDRDKE